MPYHLRLARPVSNLKQTISMYTRGLGLHVIGDFQDHEGFDGVMLGMVGMDYHFEFTHCHQSPVYPSPTHEDLIVFYIDDSEEWQGACDRMLDAGFKQASSFNPYWDARGLTFIDFDGYRVVLQNAAWQILK